MTSEAVMAGCARTRRRRSSCTYAPTIPHVALQVPEAALKEYEGAFPEAPYTGDNRYLPTARRAPRMPR